MNSLLSRIPLLAVSAVFWISAAISAAGQPGTVTGTFAPVLAGGGVNRVAVRPDGNVLVTGNFTSVEGIPVDGIALLTPEGRLVRSFKPDVKRVGNWYGCLVAYPDGRMLVGQDFYANESAGRGRGLVRLLPDGAVDASFQPDIDTSMLTSASLQKDGKILVCGETFFYRLNPDGSRDTAFNPQFMYDKSPFVAIELADGKILTAGTMGWWDGGTVSRSDIVRLFPDGSIDLSFGLLPADNWGYLRQLIEQPDGKILVVGSYVGSTGPSWQGVKRLNADGSVDAGFNTPFPVYSDNRVNQIVLQADGKLLMACSLPTSSAHWPNAIVRLTSTGAIDPTFTKATGTAECLAITPDGGVIAAGYLGFNGAQEVSQVTKLFHDSTPASLILPDASSVKWTRGGASFPEQTHVKFDLLAAGQTEWTPLGDAQRVADGWSLTGLALPQSGIIRMRSEGLSGQNTSAALEMFRNFGDIVPAMVLSGPDGALLPPGGLDFGNVLSGQTRFLRLGISNTGSAALTGLLPSIPAGSSFTIVSKPGLPILPGQTGYLELQYMPTVNGLSEAFLTIASNDPGGNRVITLRGTQGNTINPVFYGPGDVLFTNQSFIANPYYLGQLQLAYTPRPGDQLMVVRNLGTQAISGKFNDLPDGSTVSAIKDGVTYTFVAGYAAGDGNDIVLTLLGPGVLDPGYTPSIVSSSGVIALPEIAERAVVGGQFSTVKGVSRKYIAEIDGAGPSVGAFDPKLDGGTGVEAIFRLPDGKLLVGGSFSAANGALGAGIVRLNPDGSVDPTFKATANSTVTAIAVQPDGRILIAGAFTMVNSISRNRLARLYPDGSLDASLTATTLNAGINCLAVQADGKILAGGSFVVSGFPDQLQRLLPDGSLDTSFNVTIQSLSAAESVDAIIVEPSGGIVIAGRLERINSTAVQHVVRLTPAGEVDTSFAPAPNSRVRAIQRQADGSFLIGGEFLSVGVVEKKRFARISAQGVLDPSFAPEFGGGVVTNIALRPDGSVLVGGAFTTVNGVARRGLVRIFNHPISSSVEITGSSKVRWTRGGTLPDEKAVRYEVRENGILEWRSVGAAHPVAGGWEAEGLNLPATCLLRANSTIPAVDATYQQVTGLGPIGAVRPILEVTAPASRKLERASARLDFGPIPTSLSTSLGLVALNSGTADLTGFTATVSGGAAADFSVSVAPPSSLPAAESASLRVTFSPTARGTRTAELRLSGNDPEGDFVIVLTGEGGSGYSPMFHQPDELPVTVAQPDLTGMSFGGLRLGFAPQPGTVLIAIRNTGGNPISGTLAGLPDQSFVTASFAGKEYVFLASYRGGAYGNDLVFILNGPAVAVGTFAPTPNGGVAAMALQPDGKILISGFFTTVQGTTVGALARLLPDGALDPTFLITGTRAESMAVQDDGKILIASDLTAPGGVQRLKLGRLNADGSLDESFQTNINGTVMRICLLRNGQILVGGTFTRVNDIARTGTARLNSDGTLDTAFTANLGGLNGIYALAEQPDGKIIIGGYYTSINGTGRNHLGRVGVNGAVDSAFNPAMTTQAGGASSIAVQPDGKIVVGGYISGINGVAKSNIVRLNANGTLDTAFLASANQPCTCIRLQADGKIMLSGLFTTMNGEARPALARLNADGSLDPTYNPKPSRNSSTATSWVYTMVMPPDGGLLIGGIFDHVEFRGGANFAKLGKDEMISEIIPIGGSKVRWNTGGALTQMHQATFDVSTDDGDTWSLLGAGVKTSVGWSIEGISLPPAGLLRARGTQILTSRAASALTSEILPFTRQDLTALESWRDANFGDAFDGTGDFLDYDHDGLKNIVEFAYGLNPRSGTSAGLPLWALSGDHYESMFNVPANVDGIIYGAEWSQTMGPGDWHAAEDVSSGSIKKFRVPAPAGGNIFIRHKIVKP